MRQLYFAVVSRVGGLRFVDLRFWSLCSAVFRFWTIFIAVFRFSRKFWVLFRFLIGPNSPLLQHGHGHLYEHAFVSSRACVSGSRAFLLLSHASLWSKSPRWRQALNGRCKKSLLYWMRTARKMSKTVSKEWQVIKVSTKKYKRSWKTRERHNKSTTN